MDYPQWLLLAYVRSARAAGADATDEELTAAATRLIERWSEPGRHHHGIHHLADMLSRITTLAPETHNPDLVSLAAFYHGCVFSTADRDTYTRNGGENENESARVASAELTSIGISADSAARITNLIAGMKKQPRDIDPTATASLNALDMDQLALRDAHLGALAAGPQKYSKYVEEVAKEYSRVPEDQFLQARRAIISRLLARRRIFLSPLGRQWEAPARDNLEGELDRIDARLAALSNTGAEHDASETAESADEGPLTPQEYASLRSMPAAPVQLPAESEAEDSQADRSSLETLPESSEPGPPPLDPRGEKRKQAEREEITRMLQERIAHREGRRLGEARPEPAPAPPPRTQRPLSAPTPEWHDDNGTVRAGFEREPDY